MATIIIFGVVLIIFGLVKNASNRQRDRVGPSPRAQRLLQKIQAQQAPNQQPRYNQQPRNQGQYGSAPMSGATRPGQQPGGRAQAGAQLAGMLQQLLQSQSGAGQQPGYTPPGQYQPAQYQQPVPQIQFQQAQRPQHGQLPGKNSELEKRVRELMKTGHEVSAIRLLSDEQDLGIIEAQEYARGLIAPPGKPDPESAPREAEQPGGQEETRYVGSAAFAESLFELDRDENVWASGWVDKPEPEDRSDMDELWQTVRDGGRPAS
jgi:hypothetical protein